MSRPRSVFCCSDCGARAARWGGRCPTCGEWNTLAEEIDPAGTTPDPAADRGGPPVAMVDVDATEAAPRQTGVEELDRVLGGGLVPGSVTLVGGEPGIGKSTLLLQALAKSAGVGRRGLLVCAEESPQQVRRRADRLGALRPGVWLITEPSLPAVVAAVQEVGPDLLVVDSIQTVYDPAAEGPPGSVSQVRACAQALVQLAKARPLSTVLVGHVTKEGALAGPRVLEHVVDTVLTFEGERHHALRLLRAIKHRFAPTGELGLFEMTGEGLRGVADPSGMLLGDRRTGAPGSAVFPAMEGQRPLLVELQALVTGTGFSMPRRSGSGLDGGRLSLLVAVLEERAGLSLAGRDIYASAVGGVRVSEPGADLGLCLALASAARSAPLPPDLVVCGEVGLAGEIRQVAHTGRRLVEAARLGFGRALVPWSAHPASGPMELTPVATLAEAVAWAGLEAMPSSAPDPPGPRGHLGADSGEPGVPAAAPVLQSVPR